jgi:LuxR family maltose regulon positive regulatory protein
MDRRLTLLVAPTGYGKTTLLVEWLSGVLAPDWRVIWLTVDSFDNEPFRLWSYFATALKKAYPRLRFDPQRFFQDSLERPMPEILTPLLNAITQIPYQLVLVLDDYQWITDDRVHEEIRYLLDHQPKNLHLLISSRVVPPFPLSRLRAQRQLVELSAKDLSFTLKEAERFFSCVMDVDIDHDQAASLVVATEGWIAGLQLVTLSLQGQPDRKSFLARLPMENYQIFEYLTEEVLDQQTPELRDFLLKTSLLSELSAPLCDAMLARSDSQEMLTRIQQANLFIVSKDERHFWYSYHRLFADTLQKYLRSTYPDTIVELHRRASAWLQENGYPDQAVLHALAYGDMEQAARIIDACALQAVITFDLVQLAQWISRFSDELLSQRPQLGIYYALANFLIERFDKVEPKLQELEQILDRPRETELRREDEKLIRWEIAAIRACLDYWTADSENILSRFEWLMNNPPESDVYFRGLMSHNIAEVYAARGNLDEAANWYLKGRQFAVDYRLVREYCYSQSELAYVRKMLGYLQTAAQDYQDLIDYTLRFGISDDVLAFAKTGLVEIALEQNRMKQADELAHWVIENYERIEASPLNWIRQEWIFIRLARYYLACQDVENCLLFFNKAMNGFLENRQVVHFISSQLIDLQVRIWLATGELHGKTLNIEEKIATLDPMKKALPARQLAMVRYSMAQGEYEKALVLLTALQPELEKSHMRERLMEALILRALAEQALGQKDSAVRSLGQALHIAMPEGYLRVFLEEGAPMKTLLKTYARQILMLDAGIQEAQGKMVASLIGELEKKSAPAAADTVGAHIATELIQPMQEPFSQREYEILHLIVNDKSTKEMAVALALSINTIKVHMKSIYRKTGTHTRSALKRRVVELGVLKNATQEALVSSRG